MNKDDLQVDQAMVVWVGCPTSRRYDGRVAKIARKYVTIEYWRSPGNTSEIEFDIETQKERGNTSHYAARFRTPAQQDWTDRQQAVQEGLHALGLRASNVTSDGRLTLEEGEAIIELVRSMRLG
jgi:hypothetical protein